MSEETLENFLRTKAKQIKPSIFEDSGFMTDVVRYREHTNEDAINGEVWLENNTSFIWKVGVLATWDANKCDWVNIFIGHHRKPNRPMEFIGHLYWQDGENDDIARCLKRYLDILGCIHPVFHDV